MLSGEGLSPSTQVGAVWAKVPLSGTWQGGNDAGSSGIGGQGEAGHGPGCLGLLWVLLTDPKSSLFPPAAWEGTLPRRLPWPGPVLSALHVPHLGTMLSYGETCTAELGLAHRSAPGPCFLHSTPTHTLPLTAQVPSLPSHPWGQAFITSHPNFCEHPLTSQPESLSHLLPLFTTGQAELIK